MRIRDHSVKRVGFRRHRMLATIETEDGRLFNYSTTQSSPQKCWDALKQYLMLAAP